VPVPGRHRLGFVRLLGAMALGSALSSVAHAQGIETAVMPGQVIQGHAKLEADCKNCHVRFNRAAQTGLCLDCHKDVARDFAQHKGYHGQLQEKECRSCHTEHKGRGANISPLPRAFDHASTGFALRGAHAAPKVQCAACHVAGKKFRDAPSDCHGCHARDDKHRGSLGTACADCHKETAWKDTRFDHGKTRFPLRNRHADVPCKSCHVDPKFKGAPLACVSCHDKDDQKKGHQGRFGGKCESCHSDRGWKAATFDHNRDTKYPLRGLHQKVGCNTCHRAGGQPEKLATGCVACHKGDDAKQGHHGMFGEKCESCHVETGWKATRFNHARDAHFQLRGRHAQLKCVSCHVGLLYREKLGTTCASCHAENDVHKGKLGPKCDSCHNETAWKQTRFDHGRTRFPLVGGHAKVTCKACHVTQQFKDAPTDCAACHKKNDVHKGALGAACQSCHGVATWKQARFDHGLARFPLLGKHATTKCKDCHRTQQFKDSPTACYACHRKDDRHKLRLGTRCEQCHEPRRWSEWSFDHDRSTSFRLEGGHRGLDCAACHKAPMPSAKLAGTCVSCHEDRDVHNGAFGRFCDRCHVASSFKTLRSGGSGRLFQ
jgi:hypothetical protein